jgi:hypothetical protein
MLITEIDKPILLICLFIVLILSIYIIHLIRLPKEYHPVSEIFDNNSIKYSVDVEKKLKEIKEEYHENE